MRYSLRGFASKGEVACPAELLRGFKIRDSGVAKLGMKLEDDNKWIL